jgi:rhamnosyltransferase
VSALSQTKAHAVIVTFHPEGERFVAELRALASQVAAIVLVDNGGPDSKVGELLRANPIPGCVLLAQRTNNGLAAAQNAGIQRALSAGAENVLLLDDDSMPGEGMVELLLRAIGEAAARGEKVAAAGPRYVEEQSAAESYFQRYSAFGARRLRCANQTEVLRTDALISSGMLIPAAVLRDMGTMDESLFIDHVDTDWCMRARARGYELIGVCAASMSHRLGDKPSRKIAGRRIFFRSPDRHYYMFRNSILLYRRRHAPLGWAVGDAAKLVATILVIAAFCAPRAQHLAAVAGGIVDGFRGRAGPRPQAARP